jgi:hypothetical protein
MGHSILRVLVAGSAFSGQIICYLHSFFFLSFNRQPHTLPTLSPSSPRRSYPAPSPTEQTRRAWPTSLPSLRRRGGGGSGVGRMQRRRGPRGSELGSIEMTRRRKQGLGARSSAATWRGAFLFPRQQRIEVAACLSLRRQHIHHRRVAYRRLTGARRRLLRFAPLLTSAARAGSSSPASPLPRSPACWGASRMPTSMPTPLQLSPPPGSIRPAATQIRSDATSLSPL